MVFLANWLVQRKLQWNEKQHGACSSSAKKLLVELMYKPGETAINVVLVIKQFFTVINRSVSLG
jgi:hypothetical protein